MTVDAREIDVHIPQVTEKYWGYPEDIPEPPSFCRCGRALVRLDEKSGHDTDTGEQRYTTTWRCPKTTGLWNRATLTFMTHDEYELSNFLGWYWQKRRYP